MTCNYVIFFNDTATTEIYTLSLHDALPICPTRQVQPPQREASGRHGSMQRGGQRPERGVEDAERRPEDRKSTRLNSSHANISYAVFCLKKKKRTTFKVYSIT